MKLELGNTMLETDYIEYLQRIGLSSITVYFISGAGLDIVCGLKTAS